MGTQAVDKRVTNQIFQRDCIEGMRELLKPRSVSVVVTSPPYNISKNYNSYDDARPVDEYMAWLEQVAIGVKRVLADKGSFFLNVGGKPTNQWLPMDIAQRMRKHFHLQNTLMWIKSVAIQADEAPSLEKDVAVGHYKPLNSRRYVNDCFEYVFQFTKSGDVEIDKLAIGVPYQDKSNIKRWKAAKRDRRDRGNTWFVPYDTIQKGRPHPSIFPVRLPEMCILLHGLERTRLVLDPFMGTGSTAVACVRLGVPYVGFEIDPPYVKLAKEAVAQSAPLTPGAKDDGHLEVSPGSPRRP